MAPMVAQVERERGLKYTLAVSTTGIDIFEKMEKKLVSAILARLHPKKFDIVTHAPLVMIHRKVITHTVAVVKRIFNIRLLHPLLQKRLQSEGVNRAGPEKCGDG